VAAAPSSGFNRPSFSYPHFRKDTAPMTAHPDLDPRAILATLGYGDDVRAITPATGGFDTAIWRVDRPEGSYALRVFRPEQDRACAREAAVLGATLPGVPIPRLHAVGTWHDRPAMLIGWCPGRTLVEAFGANPARLPALAAEFGRVQARLHAAPVPPALLAERRHWLDWQRSGAGALGERLRAVERTPPSILHLDFHPLNVLVDGGRVSAVLDWTNVHAGDRRADLARTLTILRLSPLPDNLPQLVARLVLRLFERNWRRGYRSIAGPVGGMAPFYAWAGVAMINDLSPRLGRGVTDEELVPVRRWAEHWRARAGV
jgi:aminoglycoside phosphotransferase (APT) family kinase protein